MITSMYLFKSTLYTVTVSLMKPEAIITLNIQFICLRLLEETLFLIILFLLPQITSLRNNEVFLLVEDCSCFLYTLNISTHLPLIFILIFLSCSFVMMHFVNVILFPSEHLLGKPNSRELQLFWKIYHVKVHIPLALRNGHLTFIGR